MSIPKALPHGTFACIEKTGSSLDWLSETRKSYSKRICQFSDLDGHRTIEVIDKQPSAGCETIVIY